MTNACSSLLTLALALLALWIMLRPLFALAAPAKPVLKLFCGALLGLLCLLLSAVLAGVRQLLELSCRA